MMHPPYRTIASIYNPDLLTKEQLINSFVVRIKKFEKIMADLRTATMEKPEQPIMLVGLRGMGKTTLLRRIAYEVENDPNLNKWLLPIIFNEEEYGITTLFKLWETIAEYLAKRDPAFSGLYERMDAEHRRDGDRHRYEQKAFEILLEAIRAKHKKLLLIIDNFGDMFKRFNKQEKQRLREIMMTCADLRVIAASALILEAFVKYDDPLYEFFKTERLDGLSREETDQLLLKLGEYLPENPVPDIIEQQPQRVEALRRVTGGIPRSIVFMFEIFVKDRDGTAFTDLESILDRVTPLYKHRMDDLPTQQQEIMQALALHYDAMSAREVAERTRLDSKLVSAQLRQLQQAELVQTVETHTKNHLYHVRDRFFNIWFLMRMARKSDRNRVLWLVRFLECWCDSDQLSKRSDAHRKALFGQGYEPRAAYYMSTALFYADQESIDSRYQMARQTQHYLRDTDLYTQIEQSDVAYFSKAIDAIRKKQYEEAQTALTNLQDKNAQDYLLLYVLEERAGNPESAQKHYQNAVKKGLSIPERLIGEIYWHQFQDADKAEFYLQKAMAKGDAKAIRFLGNIYSDTRKNYEKAKELYHSAIEKGDERAWINLGNLYLNVLKDYAQAEICYQKGAEASRAIGWRYLGIMYADNLKKYPEAEAFFQKAIDAEETYAWINWGNLYRNILKNYTQAEIYYQKGAEAGHAVGWHNLGIMYAYDLKKHPEAEAFFQKAIDAGETYAWINWGNLYCDTLKNYTQAEIYYQKGAEAGHADGWNNLGIMYANDLKKYPEAEAFYQKAIDAGETYAWVNLGNLYRNNLKDYTQAESCYQKSAEAGHAVGWQYLGIMYADNLKKSPEAEVFFQKAIDAGETYAWINWGNLYRNILKNYTQAEIYYQKGAEAGHADGWRNLGIMYAYDLKKHPEAEAFFQKAIDAGETYAWVNLGNLYRNNLKDYTQAESCYQKSAEAGHAVGWQYLGSLYGEHLNNIEKGIGYYRKAIEMGYNEAYNNLSWHLFLHKIQAEESLAAAEKAFEQIPEHYVVHTLACAALWNEHFERAHEVANTFLYDQDYVSEKTNDDDWQRYFLLLLAKSQYPFLYQYFTSEEGKAIHTRERFAPMWYALMYYLREEHPLEFLRMPPELGETVQEIIEKVEEYRTAYALEAVKK